MTPGCVFPIMEGEVETLPRVLKIVDRLIEPKTALLVVLAAAFAHCALLVLGGGVVVALNGGASSVDILHTGILPSQMLAGRAGFAAAPVLGTLSGLAGAFAGWLAARSRGGTVAFCAMLALVLPVWVVRLAVPTAFVAQRGLLDTITMEVGFVSGAVLIAAAAAWSERRARRG